MSTRRPNRPAPSAPDATIERFAGRMEERTDRILDMLSEVKDDVRRIEERQGQHTLDQNTLSNRIADIEREVLETRESMQVQAKQVTQGRVESAKAALASAARSPFAIMVASATGITAIIAMTKNLGPFLIASEAAVRGLWQWLKHGT